MEGNPIKDIRFHQPNGSFLTKSQSFTEKPETTFQKIETHDMARIHGSINIESIATQGPTSRSSGMQPPIQSNANSPSTIEQFRRFTKQLRFGSVFKNQTPERKLVPKKPVPIKPAFLFLLNEGL